MFDKRYLMSRQEQNNLFLIKIKRKKFCNESFRIFKGSREESFRTTGRKNIAIYRSKNSQLIPTAGSDWKCVMGGGKRGPENKVVKKIVWKKCVQIIFEKLNKLGKS